MEEDFINYTFINFFVLITKELVINFINFFLNKMNDSYYFSNIFNINFKYIVLKSKYFITSEYNFGSTQKNYQVFYTYQFICRIHVQIHLF